ncbi:hypothetical protein [Gracilinema caldarium]|uniref:Uncharacterized protein n=1 Tax=Gracilinema caldarium (strain ATCC 51460 / DSM 7334 / H1) TaxID=744872 RepID=F8F0E5_GRAC1|nr:hypothetical protein [Gracilinema caldarium]AEJ19289.1 hypothetical protein Spica_1143 [Gracilinema caldarium DSM 7334]
MTQMAGSLDVLSTRNGFNTAVRHIKKTLSIIDTLSTSTNLADILEEEGEDLTNEQRPVILRMLLADKMGYKTASANLTDVAKDISSFTDEIARWKAVDIVITYYHPDMGVLIANPKRKESLLSLGTLKKHELLVVFVGKMGKPTDELCERAAQLVLAMFQDMKVKIPEALYKGEFTVKQPKAQKKSETVKPVGNTIKSRKGIQEKKEKTPVQTTAPVAQGSSQTSALRMTPMYSVVVQNELFHNGNVEAWKRIIESYKTKYPDLEVYIYYEGERIININSLFKWGKVKHGSTIQFAVAGKDIKDVAKLQRYLMQGASPQFEAFLKGPVSTVLKLF